MVGSDALGPAGFVYNPVPGEKIEEEVDFKCRPLTLNKETYEFEILNQLHVPDFIFEKVEGVEDAFQAIKQMKVRGAPLIARVALLGLAVELHKRRPQCSHRDEFRQFVFDQCAYLVTSRPTAVNLRHAIDDLLLYLNSGTFVDVNSFADNIEAFVLKFIDYEDHLNRVLVSNGALCVEANSAGDEKLTVMHICNTGSLATDSLGTALGVIRALHMRNRLKECLVLETRPYLQGARLTTFELETEGIPFTLITDNMAAWAMKTKKVHAVIVGADHVAKNGDTANKIGTYMLAVLANHHRIPFFVAAPISSINLAIESGKDIVIEERDKDEVLIIKGQRIASEECPVWNPAFDVTPGELITGFITDFGNFSPTQLYDGIREAKKIE